MRSLTVRVPGDKSITHRAFLFASLAHGESVIRGALRSADTLSTQHVLKQSGIRVAEDSGVMHVTGAGLSGWSQPDEPLDCGNSGTTARLSMGILAAQRFQADITGDASLSARPMRRVIAPLTDMGAVFTELGEPGRLPLRIRGGALQALRFESPQSSAQVKSALLLAGLCADAAVTLHERPMSRDHTERMLVAMGVPLNVMDDADGSRTVTIAGAAPLRRLDIDVPGDFSSAAFFLAGALMQHDVEILLPDVGMNPGRIGMLRVLRRMNAVVAVENERTVANEPVADLRIAASALKATNIEGDEVPSLIDELPVIAVLAVVADGETRVSGAGELRVKETDRVHAIVSNLRAIGVQAEELSDGFVIAGTDAPLRGRVRAFGDHRIAMAFGILASRPGNDISIDDPDVVAVSYPDFWHELARIQERSA